MFWIKPLIHHGNDHSSTSDVSLPHINYIVCWLPSTSFLETNRDKKILQSAAVSFNFVLYYSFILYSTCNTPQLKNYSNYNLQWSEKRNVTVWLEFNILCIIKIYTVIDNKNCLNYTDMWVLTYNHRSV